MHTMDNTDVRTNSHHKPSVVDILLIGEQLRIQMHTARPPLIGDRTYFFYTYSCCFIGKEAVNWLLKNGEILSRREAVYLMRLLQRNHIIESVANSNNFLDGSKLYRFKKDSGTFPWNEDVAFFLKARRLFKKLLKVKSSAMRTVFHENILHPHAFYGNEMVTWLLRSREVRMRDTAVSLCRKMLQNEIIRHVNDRFHFRDEPLLYEFKCDFSRKKTLKDLLIPEQRRGSLQPCQLKEALFSESLDIPINNNRSLPVVSTAWTPAGSATSMSSYFSDEGIVTDTDQYTDTCQSPESIVFSSSPALKGDFLTSKVQYPRVTVEELEKIKGSYIKKHVRIMSDPVGYGFVIRGDAPVHVQTVDPSGPAAHAGLKAGQFIYAVNDKINVLRMRHKDLAKVILASDGYVDLVVMEPQSEAHIDSDTDLTFVRL